jgi:uncharacterized protein with PIN domain
MKLNRARLYLQFQFNRGGAMGRTISSVLIAIGCVFVYAGIAGSAEVSEATQECIDCHISIHPGIVSGWQKSRHAAITPKQAMTAEDLALKVSSKQIPAELQDVAVGCAECHTLRPDAHKDTFEHNGYQVHMVVSPKDCATCHTVEAQQYSKNIMSHAIKNLADNKLYQQLQHTILGGYHFQEGQLSQKPADGLTLEEACYYCHGTVLSVAGSEVRDTVLGEMEFPKISGWPNQGVGRQNLDGSLGSCSACHTRHTFSIEMARKPHTCKECHVGPDVPAYKVYSASKHGNIYSALKSDWNFKTVPWTIGKDITAPTCAACHISLLTNEDGEVIAERTHQMTNRLSWRLFGLVYAHPQPKEPDTSIIRNANGRPLPTDLEGGLARNFLIDQQTQKERTETMQAICLSCHGTGWVKGHWRRLENTIQKSNGATRAATQLMQNIWQQGYAKGFPQEENPFNEYSERIWSDVWLIYANTIRFAAAMGGGGDYGVFANGRYQLSGNILKLENWYQQQVTLEKIGKKDKATK